MIVLNDRESLHGGIGPMVAASCTLGEVAIMLGGGMRFGMGRKHFISVGPSGGPSLGRWLKRVHDISLRLTRRLES
jgi:hypothetical protein